MAVISVAETRSVAAQPRTDEILDFILTWNGWYDLMLLTARREMIWRKEKRACAEKPFFFCDRPLSLFVAFLTGHPCRSLKGGKENGAVKS
jgi:hypothetical protein